MRGTISWEHPQEVMPGLCFHRDPDKIAEDEQATAEEAVTREEFHSGLLQLLTEFTAAQPEATDSSKASRCALCLPPEDAASHGRLVCSSHCLGH